MSNFLYQVVSNVLKNPIDLSEVIFVLPNKRAGIYLRKHLKEQLRDTCFFPEIITFDNLVEKISGNQKTNSVKLLFEFYKVYKENTPIEKTDSFEIFTHWAKTVLDDFNLIDNHLVNPNKIFKTLHDINKIQNWDPNTELTRNYLSFLQNLELYYNKFYSRLLENQMAYQGMLFRESVEILQHFVQNSNSHFVFVGFSYLKKAESVITQELLGAGKAEIYWDIPQQFKKLYHNKNTFFDTYFNEWNHFQTHDIQWNFNFDKPIENVEIVGVAKKVGMIKYAGYLLQKETKIEDTALVLADQNTLPIALQTLPENVDNINITMGIPLKYFPFSGLLQHLFELHIQQAYSQKGFYFQNVLKILQHPVIRSLDKKMDEVTIDIISKNKVYLQPNDLENAFQNISIEAKSILIPLFNLIEKEDYTQLLNLINDFINSIKPFFKEVDLEVLFHHYQLNQQLIQHISNYTFIDNLKSLAQLYRQLMSSDSENSVLNFIGEPLQGLQLMGFLETQALDFKHLILVSTNEGILPKNKKPMSFIPFDVRKHYQLPTYQEEEMTMTYLFYRLIQRSEKVTLLYNTDADTFGGGEKSRFLTQLIWENPNIKQQIINTITPTDSTQLQEVEKNPEILKRIKELYQSGVSPSALATYVYNPIDFYRNRILKIDELEEIEETVAEKTLGNVVHGTLEEIYKPFIGSFLEESELAKKLLELNKIVEFNFIKEYKNGNVEEGKNKLIYEVAVNFVKRFIRQEINLLKKGHQIKIINLEHKVTESFVFSSFNYPITFSGYVDRIDEFDGVLRIIDYKTGKVDRNNMRITNFGDKIENYKYSKALQVMLYACMVSKYYKYDPTSTMLAGIISFKNHKSGFLPVNFAHTGDDNEINKERQEDFLGVLENLLQNIANPEINFVEKVV